MVCAKWSEMTMTWLGEDGCKELYVCVPEKGWMHYSAVPGVRVESYSPLHSRGFRTMQWLLKLGVKMVMPSKAGNVDLKLPVLQTGVQQALTSIDLAQVMSH